jgi:hypothetical protein
MEVRHELGLRPGGFGIPLVQHLVDQLVYNETVLMVKYRRSSVSQVRVGQAYLQALIGASEISSRLKGLSL